MNDDIRDLLARGASDAVDTDLVSGVWQRAQRHRRNRNLGIVSLAAAGVALTFTLTQIGGGEQAPVPADHTATHPAPATQEPDTPPLPEGWRWESFGGVQVGVPGDWDWGSPSQRIYQWCLNNDDVLERPIVGRAGISTSAGCDVDGPSTPPKDSLVENTGEVVMLGWSEVPDVAPVELGDRTTVQLDGVQVVVQAEQPLRDQIVETVHTVETDANGCQGTHPISTDSTWRPTGPALDDPAGVTAVSICRYELRDSWPSIPEELAGSLKSSSRLTGQAAQTALDTIARAPHGGGPNSPENCAPDFRYGDEAIVLEVTSESGESQVVARYSGCDHHGFDDGHVIRALTVEAIAPLVEEPNLPESLSGEVGDIIFAPLQED